MAIKNLPIREEVILRLRYGIDVDASHTLEEVGRLFHLTKERIRQIEERAVKRIKKTSYFHR
jgi:RNA polymerase primary sigma factor